MRSTASRRGLLDPNAWSKDGTIALAGLSVSDDGQYIAYGTAEAGSDWNTWKVLDVKSASRWATNSSGSSSATRPGRRREGLLLQPLPGAGDGRDVPVDQQNQRLYYHRLGTPQAEDVLVYVPAEPKWTVTAASPRTAATSIIDVGDGTTSRKYRVYYKDLLEPSACRRR